MVMLKYFESVLIIYMFAYNIPYSLYGFSVTPSFLFGGLGYAHKKAWELLEFIPIQGCLA